MRVSPGIFDPAEKAGEISIDVWILSKRLHGHKPPLKISKDGIGGGVGEAGRRYHVPRMERAKLSWEKCLRKDAERGFDRVTSGAAMTSFSAPVKALEEPQRTERPRSSWPDKLFSLKTSYNRVEGVSVNAALREGKHAMVAYTDIQDVRSEKHAATANWNNACER